MNELLSKVAVVDLFCGAGGLAYGLQLAGLPVMAGFDIDPFCRFPFETNLGARFVQCDVAELTPPELQTSFGDRSVRVLAGCAPCQPFSGYSSTRKGPDERWRLLLELVRLVEGTMPQICTIENVPRLAKLGLWREVLHRLSAVGYHISWGVLNCAHFGVAQHRQRLVLLASRLGEISLPAGTSEPTSVRDIIGKFPKLSAGGKDPLDRLHAARGLSASNLTRIQASRPGGTWKEWAADIRTACHARASGRTYPSIYGRMRWDKPAPTITTQFYGFGNGRFGHPEQDRAISIREAASLQSFPAEFQFLMPREEPNFRRLGRLIGNAVPPLLGKAIGDTIRSHLQDYYS